MALELTSVRLRHLARHTDVVDLADTVAARHIEVLLASTYRNFAAFPSNYDYTKTPLSL